MFQMCKTSACLHLQRRTGPIWVHQRGLLLPCHSGYFLLYSWSILVFDYLETLVCRYTCVQYDKSSAINIQYLYIVLLKMITADNWLRKNNDFNGVNAKIWFKTCVQTIYLKYSSLNSSINLQSESYHKRIQDDH